MTRYIINDTLIFDSAIAKLSFADNGDKRSTGLSAPAARCLENLIISRGNVLNKITLLEKSWNDYGFIVTDNSVNQVISHLRKGFERLGFSKDIIVTVPKLGYQFNPEYKVDILRIETGEPQESHDPPGNEIPSDAGAIKNGSPPLRLAFRRYKMVFIAAGVTTIIHLVFSIGEYALKSAGLHQRMIDCLLSYLR